MGVLSWFWKLFSGLFSSKGNTEVAGTGSFGSSEKHTEKKEHKQQTQEYNIQKQLAKFQNNYNKMNKQHKRNEAVFLESEKDLNNEVQVLLREKSTTKQELDNIAALRVNQNKVLKSCNGVRTGSSELLKFNKKIVKGYQDVGVLDSDPGMVRLKQLGAENRMQLTRLEQKLKAHESKVPILDKLLVNVDNLITTSAEAKKTTNQIKDFQMNIRLTQDDAVIDKLQSTADKLQSKLEGLKKKVSSLIGIRRSLMNGLRDFSAVIARRKVA